MREQINTITREMAIIEQSQLVIDRLLADAAERKSVAEAEAPDKLACADSFNEICRKAFGSYLYEGNRLSTYFLRKALRESPLFRQTNIPAPGDVVISPSGFASQKNPDGSLVIPNGHVGIIMSTATSPRTTAARSIGLPPSSAPDGMLVGRRISRGNLSTRLRSNYQQAMFSPTYVSVLVALLSQILPMLGVEIGNDNHTNAITTILTIVAALVILVRRYWKGDVTVVGAHR